MVIVAPPKPPQEEQDLEALIEEARRRARRRRLLVAAASALGLVLVGGILAAVLLTRGGGNARAVPPGFHLVKARGPVSHWRIQELGKVMPILVDVRTGETRRPGLTMDIWWDRKTGLDRAVGTIDGRKSFDLVGQSCLRGAPQICPAPGDVDANTSGLRWPLNPKFERITGHGRLRGHDVIWATSLPITSGGSERVALDAKTHQLVARIEYARDRPFGITYYSRLPDLPAKSVSFLVPDGGAIRGTFPPFGHSVQHVHRSSLGAIRTTLGVTPQWLGPRFHGKRLRSVEAGTFGARAQDGSPLRPVRFVRLRYGDVTLQEFGGEGPFYYLQGPRSGQLAVDGSGVMITRGGVLVFARAPTLFSPASAIALAKALRPLP